MESRDICDLRDCAREVMKSLGTGHRESVYHKAMIVKLNSMGVRHRSEVVTPVMFMGECVGSGRADLVVGRVVVEIKAAAKCPASVSGQVRKYVESMESVCGRQCDGVVINFNQTTGAAELRVERQVVKRSRFFSEEDEERAHKRTRSTP